MPETPTPVGEAGLVRAIGVRALAANVVNYTIGSGIFALPAAVAAILGPTALVAYLVCAVAIGLIALCFAEIGSRWSCGGATCARTGRPSAWPAARSCHCSGAALSYG